MQALPVFLDVRDKRCLLVGRGELAVRKRRLLDKAGAVVVLAGENFSDELLQGVVLVVAASTNFTLNSRVSEIAKQHNLPVNVVDQPDLCTFIFPSIVERGPVTVAVSSGGAVPVLTRLLRARIEAMLPGTLGNFASEMAVFRKTVSVRLPDMQQRLRFWDGLLQRHFIGAGGKLDQSSSQKEFAGELDLFVENYSSALVSIVGSGPGDLDLLTFKALRCLQSCDLLVFDEGVAQEVIDLARRDARQLSVSRHDDVAAMLIAQAQGAAHIVYLKQGDPLSYREVPLLLAQLQAARIAYDVVPGIIDQSGAMFHGI